MGPTYRHYRSHDYTGKTSYVITIVITIVIMIIIIIIVIIIIIIM